MGQLVVRRGAGIGPIDLEMSKRDAIAAATAAGMVAKDFRRGAGVGAPDLAVDDQLFAYFDDEGIAREIEVAVPSGGSGRTVECLGLDLRAPYGELLDRMRAFGRADETDPEYPASSLYFELGLCFWADTKPERLRHLLDPEDLLEERVEAILVRAPEPYALD